MPETQANLSTAYGSSHPGSNLLCPLQYHKVTTFVDLCSSVSPDHLLITTVSVRLAQSCGDPVEVAFYSQELLDKMCVHTVVG